MLISNMVSFYNTQGDAGKIPMAAIFTKVQGSMPRESLQPFEHYYRAISKYKLWYMY